MPSTICDSPVFREAFGPSAMRPLFCEKAKIARYLQVAWVPGPLEYTS